MEYDYMGAIKIKDGLFLGDQFAAQDLEFVVTNKVTRIINCAGKQIPNHWESIGIAYLTFNWLDNDTQVIFDDDVISQSYKFLEDAFRLGESIIIHSVRGHNRSICILSLYFMFRWTLYKTLQYLHSRRPDLEIRANFFNQLIALEAKLLKQGQGAKTYNWDEIYEEGENKTEEILLRHTYLNAQAQGVADFKTSDAKPMQNKIKWLDEGESKQLVNMSVPPYDHIDFAKRAKPKSQKTFHPILKSLNADKVQVVKIQVAKPELPNYDILKTKELPFPRQPSSKDISDLRKKQQKKDADSSVKQEKQSLTLSQIANKQLQVKLNSPPQEVGLTATTLPLFEKFQNPPKKMKPWNNPQLFSQTQQLNDVKTNNFVGKSEQWYKKPTKKSSESQNFAQCTDFDSRQEISRPSTAPNQVQQMGALPPFLRQIKNQKNTLDVEQLIITPYKRQISVGSRSDSAQNQFRLSKRGFSPQTVYANNPYAQKSFKPWKK